ncbi:Uncharacterised protein [Moraxella lacunata]|uniref:Uncharacterized protein n=1 Tax=Moraxella lacunata TaxID=477 RepID=A0A1V4H3V1_MORLA|nr:hypothetical protein [Moraxella lacunata]OPH39241.1 hypothetical protein B5J94_01135 [Moraxella lacunata]STZ00969.1 Uncharacterised protein [Moraxella lacunata]
MNTSRQFSVYTTPLAKQHLQGLLEDKNPLTYQKHMYVLGELLSQNIISQIDNKEEVLLISTAEDADYLQLGVQDELKKANFNTKMAVFWNNHYQPSYGGSVAPIVHKYLEPNYHTAKTVIIVKSVISGSCVVRTNLLELFDTIKEAKRIFIVSPVMHINSQDALKAEFPNDIANKFEFIYFAIDAQKDKQTGEVIPGIGGQIYGLLGLTDQPARTGYIPKTIQKRMGLTIN